MKPRIGDATLRQMLEDFDAFDRFVRNYIYDQCAAAKLGAKISSIRLVDAHLMWQKDIERLKHSFEEGDGTTPDHFKHVAHLAYWLRRASPVVEFSNVQHFRDHAIADDPDIQAACDLLYRYSNEYFAFDIGVQFCRYYGQQTAIKAVAHPPQFDLDHDFVEATCYFLKEKNVSPHALFLIYKALFYRRFM